MVGMVQAMMAKPGAVGGASLSIAPTASNAALANGAAYSQNFTVTATGTVGPLTYAWSWQSGGTGFTLSGTTTATCTVTAPGRTNVENLGTLQCVVTDTGNGSAAYTTTADVDVIWGTPI